MAKKIVFTVGHGTADDGKTYDSGAVSKDGKFHEFKIAKEIGKFAQQYYNDNYNEKCDLINYDGGLSLNERINAVNKGGYDYVAEIHLNAGGGTGTECFYSIGNATGKKYAQAISKNIAAAFGVRNRGAKTRQGANGDYFGIIRATEPTANLIETLFIDTTADLNKLKTVDGQKKCGEAIAKAVATVRGLKKQTKATNKTENKKPSKKDEKNDFTPYVVRVTADALNVRAGAGTNYKVVKVVSKGEAFTIIDKKDGWGLLKSKVGWIALQYTEKV